MKPLWEVRPGFEPQGHSASDSQRDRLGVNLGPAALVLSFQAWLLLEFQFLYLILKKGAQSWAYGRTSGSASPLTSSCLSPSRCEMRVWDGFGAPARLPMGELSSSSGETGKAQQKKGRGQPCVVSEVSSNNKKIILSIWFLPNARPSVPL